MKRFFALLAMVGSSLVFGTIDSQDLLNKAHFAALSSSVGAQMLDWRVGDEMNYRLSMGFIRGTLKKEVFNTTEETLWLRQKSVVNMFGRVQEDLMEIEMEKATGKVLRMIRNGEEQEVPDDDKEVEIIEQEYTSIEVPAGTFESIYLKLNTKDVKNVELWMNPSETVMDGNLKTIAPAQLTVTLELESFKKAK